MEKQDAEVVINDLVELQINLEEIKQGMEDILSQIKHYQDLNEEMSRVKCSITFRYSKNKFKSTARS